MRPRINILWLYPNEMNTYGDYGNALVLEKRLKWRNYDCNIINFNTGDDFPENVDLVIGGGGEGSEQDKVYQDLLRISPTLHKLANAGTPMLMVCGMYQLFGESLITKDGVSLQGVNIFAGSKTTSSNPRINGNVSAQSKKFGALYGYENHNGRTKLNKTRPLAHTQIGAGNNGQDETEGARYKNVIGTYLNGAVLSKNPKLADFLISKALEKKLGKEIILKPLSIDSEITKKARDILADRPR